MERDEMNKEIGAHVAELRAHAKQLTDLCENLAKIANGGEAAITAMKEAKVISEDMKAAKEALDKVRKAMKARATAVLKEV